MTSAVKFVFTASLIGVGFVCLPRVAGATPPGNTHLGAQALKKNTGSNNTAVGYEAMDPNALCTGSGTPNGCCTGSGAGTCGNTGGANTAVGVWALLSNTTGSSNNAVGVGALVSNTTGSDNTAVGDLALSSNTAGGANAALGRDALLSNTTGSSNTAVGKVALAHNTTGSTNTAVGDSALTAADADNNTAVGQGALSSDTTGADNLALGHVALNGNVGGQQNVAVGSAALYNNHGGNLNTVVGFFAGANIVAGSNNIEIGNVSGPGDESQVIRIGASQTKTFIAGIKGGNNNGGGQQTVTVDNNGQLGTVVSSRRYKRDIRTMGDASTPLLRLRPVTFRYKPERDPSGELQYGLIAEEVASVMPNLVIYNAQGRPESVKYQLLDSLLLNEVQKQARTVKAQAQQIEVLTAQVQQANTQAQQIEALTARLVQLEATVGAQGHTPAVEASYQRQPRF